MSSSIIYQNAEGDVTLIDLPASIAMAQDCSRILLSSAPLQAPIDMKMDYQPRSQKSQSKTVHDVPSSTYHTEHKVLIEKALAQIKANITGSWCRPRQLMTLNGGNKRKGDDNLGEDVEVRLREWATQKNEAGTALDFSRMMASLGVTSDDDTARVVAPVWTMSHRIQNSPPPAETASTDVGCTEPWTNVFHNAADVSTQLTISQSTSPSDSTRNEYRFTVPPHSTILLGDCTHPSDFRASLRHVTNEYSLPRHFDLVLLDPPWPNRSAKRKGAYDQVGGMPHITKMLLRMDIDSYLEHDALVGIWITNKDSLRSYILGPGGLFEMWNVGLIEEWIWIKTTTRGEAIFDMDNAMRKPYETLLLGRAAPNSWTKMVHAAEPRKRVIAAVPDVHSRKPCLKELLEAKMAFADEYSALEVFARHLVAGWTAWGNEVIKYNWDGYWVGGEDEE